MAILVLRAPQRILSPIERRRSAPQVPTRVHVGSFASGAASEVVAIRVGLEGAAKTAVTLAWLAAPPLLGGWFLGPYGLAAGGLFSIAVYAFSDKGNTSVPSEAAPPPPPGPPTYISVDTTPVTPIDVTPVPFPPTGAYVEPPSSISYSTSCHAHYPPLSASGWRVVCVEASDMAPSSLTFGQQVYTYVQHGARAWDDDAEMAEVVVEAVGPGLANLGDPPGTTAYQLRVVRTVRTNAGPELVVPPGEVLVNVPPSFLHTRSTWDEAT